MPSKTKESTPSTTDRIAKLERQIQEIESANQLLEMEQNLPAGVAIATDNSLYQELKSSLENVDRRAEAERVRSESLALRDRLRSELSQLLRQQERSALEQSFEQQKQAIAAAVEKAARLANELDEACKELAVLDEQGRHLHAQLAYGP